MNVFGLRFGPVLDYLPALWQGFQLTAFLAVAGVVLGGGLGLLLAVLRFMAPSRLKWLTWLITAYVELIRNTPLH